MFDKNEYIEKKSNNILESCHYPASLIVILKEILIKETKNMSLSDLREFFNKLEISLYGHNHAEIKLKNTHIDITEKFTDNKIVAVFNDLGMIYYEFDKKTQETTLKYYGIDDCLKIKDLYGNIIIGSSIITKTPGFKADLTKTFENNTGLTPEDANFFLNHIEGSTQQKVKKKIISIFNKDRKGK